MDISPVRSGNAALPAGEKIFTGAFEELQAPAARQRRDISAGASFGDALAKAIDKTDDTLKSADRAARDLAAGKIENPHEVMIRLEEAHISLQWTLQIRNKLLEAYNDIMRTQI